MILFAESYDLEFLKLMFLRFSDSRILKFYGFRIPC